MSETAYTPFTKLLGEFSSGSETLLSGFYRRRQIKRQASDALALLLDYASESPINTKETTLSVLKRLPTGAWKISDFDKVEDMFLNMVDDGMFMSLNANMVQLRTDAEKSLFLKQLLGPMFGSVFMGAKLLRNQMKIVAVSESDVLNVRIGRELVETQTMIMHLVAELGKDMNKRRNLFTKDYKEKMTLFLKILFMSQLRMIDLLFEVSAKKRNVKRIYQKLDYLSLERHQMQNMV